jgi:hypothetical protein
METAEEYNQAGSKQCLIINWLAETYFESIVNQQRCLSFCI